LNAVSNKAISDYLSEKGIFHSKLGYKYLMLCIRALLDGKVDRYCMKSAYDYVATQAEIKPEQVERSIRQVIRRTEAPVPNKEFLTRALDDLALSEDANASIFGAVKTPDTT